ncbi:helix-turn-helix domain-containing protein [Solilutibacter silvestris]|uniref:helix-turn-helix domain-containing protein n=1 Tax=Solilutibacter silvestris TaxID=1645665 RepID=UPI003D3593F4
MNPALTPKQALLAQLATLTDCPRAFDYACITARHEHGVKSVDIEEPAMAIVLQGRKRVHSVGQTLEFGPGDVFLMLRPCRLDVVNIPDPDTGLYLTLAGAFCKEALQAARLLWDQHVCNDSDDIAKVDVTDLDSELRHWIHAAQAAGLTEARLAMTGLLLTLCRRGYTALLAPPPPSLAAQLREMISAQPGREWQSHHFEESLGLSGATLRRRLASENTSLRDVIASARLACAMNLLYTTRWPVKTVAASVGYRSVSSFVQRFIERYGLEPSRIGNASTPP